MPLHLVTGPANAAKARRRPRRLARAAPAAAAAARRPDGRRRRALPPRAGRGRARSSACAVLAFDRLAGEIARRAGVHGRPLGRARARARRRASPSRGPRSRVLRRLGGRRAGFPRALLRLVDELEERRVDPARWWRGGARVGGAGPGADRLRRGARGARTAPTATRWRASGAPTPCCTRGAALDALRVDPARWGGTPVVLYGFDDLTPLERDAVETLAVHAARRRPASRSPTRRAGRRSAARGEAVQVLPGARRTTHEELPARAEHYAPASRAALHHLERGLFEPGRRPVRPRGRGGRRRRAAAGRRRARRARARAAEHVAACSAGGVAPEEIAVVLRSPGDAARARRAGLRRRGRPGRRRPPAARGPHRPRPRAGGAAALRAARRLAPTTCWPGCARPGYLDVPALADRLEAERAPQRRAGRPPAARGAVGGGAPDLPARRARPGAPRPHGRGPGALREPPGAEAAAAARRAAPRAGRRSSTAPSALDARGRRRAARARCGELGALAARDAALVPGRPSSSGALGGARGLRRRRSRRPGASRSPSPRRIRARRVRALFLCGLNEGVFPRPPRARAVPRRRRAPRDQRRLGPAAAPARGRARRERFVLLRRRLAPDRAARARAGTPPTTRASRAVRSLFVDDVADLLRRRAVERRRAAARSGPPAGRPRRRRPSARRPLAAAAAPPAAVPARPPHGSRAPWARCASALWSASRRGSGCPVKWFVERCCAPRSSCPTPSRCVRGELAHGVLERASRAGSGRRR